MCAGPDRGDAAHPGSPRDAIQGDGFNPLWLEVQIAFDTIAPQQFTSDEDILKDSVKGGRLYFVLTPASLPPTRTDVQLTVPSGFPVS